MKLLLDTHTFIWWDFETARLSNRASGALFDPNNVLYLSVASVWELQIKLQLGKVQLRLDLAPLLQSHYEQGLKMIGIEVEDVLGLAKLPQLHRDPFDRMLIAQAKRGGYRLVTRDPLIIQYDVPTLW